METEQRQKRERKGIGSVYILIAGILWAAQGLFVRRLGAYGLDALQIVAFRFLVAALGCGLVLLIKEPSGLRVSLRDLPLLFAIGTGSMAVVSVTYYAALQMMAMSVASILMYTSPIWVMLLSVLVFHERITGRKTAALLLAFGGCILVSGGGGKVTVPGILLGLTSGVFYGLYSILGRLALEKHPPLKITTYGFAFAAAGLLCLSRPWEMVRVVSRTQEKLPLVLLILGLGIFTTIMPFFLYTLGLKTTQASKASILATVEPMMVTVFGAVFYRESLTAGAVLGIGGILAAVLLLNRKTGG